MIQRSLHQILEAHSKTEPPEPLSSPQKPRLRISNQQRYRPNPSLTITTCSCYWGIPPTLKAEIKLNKANWRKKTDSLQKGVERNPWLLTGTHVIGIQCSLLSSHLQEVAPTAIPAPAEWQQKEQRHAALGKRWDPKRCCLSTATWSQDDQWAFWLVDIGGLYSIYRSFKMQLLVFLW